MSTHRDEMKLNNYNYNYIVHIYAKLGQGNLLRMVRWHCPPDTGSEIRALAVRDRARHLSVTEVPHNIESLRVSEEETFVSLKLEGQSSVRICDLRPSSHCTGDPALLIAKSAPQHNKGDLFLGQGGAMCINSETIPILCCMSRPAIVHLKCGVY